MQDDNESNDSDIEKENQNRYYYGDYSSESDENATIAIDETTAESGVLNWLGMYVIEGSEHLSSVVQTIMVRSICQLAVGLDNNNQLVPHVQHIIDLIDCVRNMSTPIEAAEFMEFDVPFRRLVSDTVELTEHQICEHCLLVLLDIVSKYLLEQGPHISRDHFLKLYAIMNNVDDRIKNHSLPINHCEVDLFFYDLYRVIFPNDRDSDSLSE